MDRVRRAAHRLIPGLVAFGIAWALTPGTACAEPAESSFPGVLAEAGLSLEDLALGGPADWLGHPESGAIPYLLPHVPSLHDDPRRFLVLARNLRHAASSAAVSEEPALLTLWTVFALQPRLPGFRGMPVPVAEVPVSDGALTAMVKLLQRAPDADPLAAVDHHRPVTARPWPAPSAAENALPRALRMPLARWLGVLRQAGLAVERSWHGVDRTTLERAVLASELPRLVPGGTVWWPAVDVAAERGDDVERARASLLVLAGLEALLDALGEVPDEDLAGLDLWQAETPWGRVLLGGRGDHRYVCNGDCLAIVDLGGNDTYRGTAGAAIMPHQPVATVVDLGGDDRYGAAGGPAQGAGLGGVGVLFDGGGKDVYDAGDGAQGFGLLGYGLLWDAGGDDRFTASGGAQGAAVFGAGLLVSSGGSDTYRLLGEGQGFGGPGASGALVDLAGSDDYFAEPDASRSPGRADYHSDGRVAANNAQGAGVGRRGDLSDGHVWAGGVGVLLDTSGDDRYTAGNFAQGSGYWYGTGLLLDGAGDDHYRAVYFSQASASHFGQALLWDASGEDDYRLEQEAGAGLAYGWDFGLGVLVEGGGRDTYGAERTALGVAERSSVALFLELGGDDRYAVPEGARALGKAGPDPHRYEAGGPLRAAGLAASLGFFLDLGGEDQYPAGLAPGERERGPRRLASESGRMRPAGVALDVSGESPEDLLEWLGLLSGD